MSPAENAKWSARSPTSALSGIELLGSVVWYRSRAKIKTIFERGHPETSSSCPHMRELPQELVEMIIAHLILDTSTLKACSATCRSWYIATLPQLHHTLTLYRRNSEPARRGLIPLEKLGKMQLLPFVKCLQILQPESASYENPNIWFRPAVFNVQNLAYFSALTNLQELGINELDLRVFTPWTQRYFGHFTPTLRSLALKGPRGTDSQLLYFLGLFPNLDDFKFIGDDLQKQPTSTPVPVPRSALSLRGRLTLVNGYRVGFLRDLSKLSSGLRFRYMDLGGVVGTRFLLDTCADTLKTLRIYPGYYWPRGNTETPLRDFDLSKSRSLRSLELTVKNLRGSPSAALAFLRALLPTITSPVFSDVVIVLQEGTFYEIISTEYILLNVVRGAYEVKPFHLVFRLEIWEGDRMYVSRELRRYLTAERARGGLDFLHRPPVIVYATRARRWEGFRA